MNRHHRETGPQDLVAAARAAGVTDPRVLKAIRRTPRAAFVPAAYITRADDDAPIPIPHQQVTTQPSLPAAMIAALGLTGTEEVFEVGTGHGYQTALLARLAARVVSIDIRPDVAAQARRNLTAQGAGNVVVLTGDGTEGAPDFAPFDAIVVSAATLACRRRWPLSSGRRDTWSSRSAPGAQNMSFCTTRSRTACGECGS